jgi:RNA polymerase sigma-70 factor (ECF subfamily)
VSATLDRPDIRTTRPGRPVTSSGEADLLRALHDQHAHALWVYVVGLTGGDRSRAQDVVQETLLRAWRTPDVLAQERGSARSWLYTVARRLVIDDWRTARRRHEIVAAELPEAPGPDETERAVDRQLVVQALRTLSPDHRAVVAECYLRGSTVAEAAERLGIAAGTVKSRTHYALRALRAAMEEMGGER